MMLQKGVYPYEYIDCLKRFDETERGVIQQDQLVRNLG